jgi:hypothetical protein
VDLDLYVTDPALETVYFANRRSSSGGQLARDLGCGEVSSGSPSVEEVTWPLPRPGRYRVGVDFIDACGSGLAQAEFRVRVDGAWGPIERSGTVSLERFEPAVLEFDESGVAAGQAPQEGQPSKPEGSE